MGFLGQTLTIQAQHNIEQKILELFLFSLIVHDSEEESWFVNKHYFIGI